MPVKKIMLFDNPGEQNTGDCIKIVLEAIRENGYRHVVVASTRGRTAMAFYEALKGLGVNLAVVTHSVGFKGPNIDEFDPKARDMLRKEGIPIHTGTILSHSIEKSLMDNFSGVYPAYIIANTLRIFGQGTKVACETVMEACDAGLIPEGEEVLSIAGTEKGSDTVLLIRSRPSKRVLDMDILEILARPRGR